MVRVRFNEAAKYEFYKDILSPEEFEILNSLYPKYSVWVIQQYLKAVQEGKSKGYRGITPGIAPELDDSDAKSPQFFADINFVQSQIVEPLRKYSVLVDKRFVFSEEAKGTPFEGDPKSLDLQRMPLGNLKKLVNSSEVEEFLDGLKYKDYKKNAKYTVTYDGEDWFIALPLNFEACILFGSGSFGDGTQTQWCVSSKSSSSEENYHKYLDNIDTKTECPAVFIQNQKTKERYLLGGSQDFITDENDDELSDKARITLERSLPEEGIIKTNELTDGAFMRLLGTSKIAGYCSNCHDEIEDQRDIYIVDGDHDAPLCHDCYQDLASHCELCNGSYYMDQLNFIGEIEVCDHCLETNYSECDDCGTYFDSDEEGAKDDNDVAYCSSCVLNHEQCENCGNFSKSMEDGDDGGRYCDDCIDEFRSSDNEEEDPEEEEKFRESMLSILNPLRLIK